MVHGNAPTRIWGAAGYQISSQNIARTDRDSAKAEKDLQTEETLTVDMRSVLAVALGNGPLAVDTL
jgi:hypothetical protein